MVPYIIIIIFTKFTKEIWERMNETSELKYNWKEETNHRFSGLLHFFNATELLTLIMYNLLVSPFIEINTQVSPSFLMLYPEP